MTSPVSPPTMTGAPISPDRSDRATFSGRATAYADFQKNTFIPEVQAAIDNAFTNATSAHESAVAADASEAAALVSQIASAANASNAAASAGASAWVSGTTYAIGNKRWSLINGRVYVRRTVGAGTTDPANDPTNWYDVIFGERIRITSNTNLLVGKLYELDSTGGAFTVTLPASFSDQDRIGLRDYGLTLATNPVTVARNGANIRRTAEDLVLDVSGDSLDLVGYSAIGWTEE